MKLAKLAVAILPLMLIASAQEAKIMIVEKPDSQRLSKAYRDYKDALKHWEDIKADVAKQYTQESGKPIAGWEKVQFSADFRAIVPDSSPYAGYGYPACGWHASTLNSYNTIPLTGSASTFSASPNFTVNAGAADLTYDSTAHPTDGVNTSLTVKEKK